eukprot:12005013-Alexandrium_andersonii.AAC.1
MSASLVGSEMCIRDSFRTAPQDTFEAVFLVLVALSNVPGTSWGCHRSVSYTHLTLPTICSV